MAAPDFVPVQPTDRVRQYSSPPRRNDSWVANRPGDYDGPQPAGPHLGSSGPDQGYAYTLVDLFDEYLYLGRVDRDDAIAGCVGVAMRRSSLFGRAPVVHDLTVGFAVFGFLDPDPDPQLIAFREKMFAEIKSSHHYFELRDLVDSVKEAVLRKPHTVIRDVYESDWRSNLTY